jgi:hypothetical protein
MQLLEIAVIKEPANHVRWDLACAFLVKLVARLEVETAIGAGQRSLKPGMEKITGFDHGHAGSATIRMAVGQPKELRRFGLARHVGKYRPQAMYVQSAEQLSRRRRLRSCRC